jgi:UDP-N-acetylglucosamine diphosphorylase / glucose-1-phosphate thymidylyltransferase / UDP-N-acetylgalactosamine diphosphorylase / glucosamine-1-phosphate N-acetyltransferase / galactosamine-1-phosphate N-acetyltransferase
LVGDVIVDANCELGPNAVVFGPSYIGPDSYLGPNAEIRRSLVHSGLVMSHTGYLGHSVVGSNANLAAGFITAVRNLKRETVHLKVDGTLIDTGLKHFGAIIPNEYESRVNTVLEPGRLAMQTPWI